jgi:voltage-dependent anion channel protein 2
MAPTRFGDFSKKTGDLLSNDYSFDRKFKLTTKSAAGVTFTTESTLKPKKLDAKLTAKWSPADGLFVDKLSISSEGRLAGEATLKNALSNTDLICKVQDGGGEAPAGELEVKYTHNNFTFDFGVDVVNGPTLSASGSALVGTTGLTLGGSLKLDTKLDGPNGSPDLKDYNAGLAYVHKDVTVVVSTKDKFKEVGVSVYEDLNKDVQLGAQCNFLSKGELKSLNFGVLYQLDANTKLQTKVDNKGIVSANYILGLQPGVKGIASVQVDALNFAGDAHKLGLSLILG